VHSLPGHWNALVNALGTFVDADELYYHFSYLSAKNARRDTLGAMHISLMDELQKVLQPFELHAKSSTLPLPRRKEAEFFAKLILDTTYIVKTHSHMVSLYRTLSNPQSNLVYVELIKFLDKIERQVNAHITHPELANIKININTELFILHKLFLAEAQMTLNHQFRETIFNIYQSRADLHTWKSRMDRDGGKPASNLHLKIPLYQWLNEFINAMLAKSTFLFYKPLWRQERLTGHTDMRANVSRLELQYPHFVENFFQRTDCTFFCLVLEAEGLQGYSPDGYVCPDPTEPEPEPLSGMKLYPVIYSIPYIDEVPLPQGASPASSSGAAPHQSFSASSSSSSSSASQSQSLSHAPSGPNPQVENKLLAEHLPSIVVLLQDNSEDLALFKPKPLCVWFGLNSAPNDPGITYYLFKISPKVTAVAVYRKKIKPDDSTDLAVTDLRNSLFSHLRNSKIYSKLLPKE
jgi:hypothetical protein